MFTKSYKLFPIFFIFLIFIEISNAQKKITYEEAVKIAINKNITIQQQKNNLLVNQVEKYQSIANFLPNLNISGSTNRTKGRQWSDENTAIVNTSIDRANYNIRANYTLFSGLQNVNRLRQSNHVLKAQYERVEQTKQDVILLVAQQYLQILLDKELLVIAQQDFETQQKLYDQLNAFFHAGTRTKSELLSQESLLKKSQVDVISSQNQFRSDKKQLSKTLLLEPTQDIEIIQPDWDINTILLVQKSIDSLVQTALRTRPELKILLEEEKANKTGIQISRAGYFPSLSMFYNYGSNYSSSSSRLNPADSLYYKIAFKDQVLKDNFSQQYGFNISIPIFNRLQTYTSVVRSKINYENSKLAYKEFEIQLFIDIQNEYQNFVSFKESYLANKKSAESAQLAYEKQQELYKLGNGSLVELMVENQRYIQAQSELVQVKYTLLFQQKIIDYHIGLLDVNE